jgi:hypothetical protein
MVKPLGYRIKFQLPFNNIKGDFEKRNIWKCGDNEKYTITFLFLTNNG